MTPTLREELRQSRPFQTLEQEAFLNLVRTTTLLADDLEQLFRAAGITTAQYNVLRILMGAGADGLCRNDLRDRMVTRMPDMTRLLDRMEEAGLVSRRRGTEDRRLVSTRVTARGRKLATELEPQVAEEHRRRLGHMNDSQLRQLIDLLVDARKKA